MYKKLIFGIIFSIVAVVFFVVPSHAAVPNWNLMGVHTVTFTCVTGCSGDWVHTMNVTNMNMTSGDFSGTGYYNLDSSYTWDVTGNLNGSNITFNIHYTGTSAGSEVYQTGIINSLGNASGASTSNFGPTFTWTLSQLTIPRCIQTGFFRDSINMTAALFNPTGTVSGDVDATGCNIGVYYDQDGSINTANIYGANYFGVLVNGDVNNVSVDVKESNIYNIGEVPFNGAQHGVAIYYRSIDPGDGSVTGEISGNTVSQYQKGGITANGNANVKITNNYVSTQDLSSILAVNSVQLGYGATGTVMHNNIVGNQWCGLSDYAATAILLYDANGPIVKQNNIRGNSDIGIYAQANDAVIDNNKVFDEGLDCNQNSYDYGVGNWGIGNEITNNKVKGFNEPYDGVNGGKNKSIPGSQKINPWF